jgi:hypothetical protein
MEKLLLSTQLNIAGTFCCMSLILLIQISSWETGIGKKRERRNEIKLIFHVLSPYFSPI